MKHISQVVAEWAYKNQNGELIGKVARVEDEHGKQIIPYFNEGGTKSGIPDYMANQRPIFGVETIKQDDTVYVVEGEKCAYAVHKTFGYPAITSLGGAQAASKTNWYELPMVKTVVLVPDNDKSGIAYMKQVYKELKAVDPGIKFKILELPDVEKKGDVCDWINAQIDAKWNELCSLKKLLTQEELEELKVKFNSLEQKDIPSSWLTKQGSKGLKSMKIKDLIALELPKPKKLLDPWLTDQSLNMVYANRGVGKTYFALNCAYALATAGSFLKYTSKTPVSVCYIDGEMQAPLLIERIKSIAGGRIEDLPINIITPDIQEDRAMPDLSTAEGQAEIDELIEQFSSQVIFVDNLSTLCRTGKENDSESWNNVQSWAIKHRSQGRSIVFVHHANKGGGQRGTSKKEDILDNVIFLKRPEDYDESRDGAKFEVSFEKARSLYGADTTTILANLNQEGMWHWSNVASKEQQAYEMFKSGMKQKEIAAELDISQATVSSLINKAKNNA